MQPALRHQLAHLDRTLLALMNERARLLASVSADDPGRFAMVEDLMRRHAGPFCSTTLSKVFAAIDEGCLDEATRRKGAAR
jgi:hypothetical protein